MFVPHHTKSSYCIEVDVDDFRSLLTAEAAHDFCEYQEHTLVELLDAMDGVSGIEYDGHFGANLFVTIDVEDNKGNKFSHEEVLGRIFEIYKQCVKKAKKFLDKKKQM